MKLSVGEVVYIRGEGDTKFVVKECIDERGDMDRILVEAQIPGWTTVLPTELVLREDILPRHRI